MPAAGWEAGGAADAVRPPQRPLIAGAQRGRGREGSRVDWPAAHHERGLQMGGGQKAWEPGAHRRAPSPTVVPAVSAHRVRLDGSEVRGQPPAHAAAERASWPATVRESEAQMDDARGRFWAL